MIRLALPAPGERRSPPTGYDAVFHWGEDFPSGIPLHHNLEQLFCLTGETAKEVQGALVTAIGVWAADKFLKRTDAPDAWTREIFL